MRYIKFIVSVLFFMSLTFVGCSDEQVLDNETIEETNISSTRAVEITDYGITNLAGTQS